MANEPVPPTATPSSTPLPAGNVVITNIFYDGVNGPAEPDEYVQIRNDHNAPIQLQGWTLRDEAEHVFTFPNFLIQPGQVCRVYCASATPGGRKSSGPYENSFLALSSGESLAKTGYNSDLRSGVSGRSLAISVAILPATVTICDRANKKGDCNCNRLSLQLPVFV